MGVDLRLDLALAHLLPLVKSTPLNILRAKGLEDALRTLRCCCIWRTGHAGKAYWCGNEDGIAIWWKGESERTLIPWKHALAHATETGLLGEMVLDTYSAFGLVHADHHRWKMYYPYSPLTTAAAVEEDRLRRVKISPPRSQTHAPIQATPRQYPPSAHEQAPKRKRKRSRR